MIRHSLTLEHIARELNTMLAGSVLVTAWTQEKAQATLGFVLPSNKEQYVHINVSTKCGTVTTSAVANRAKRNSLTIFTSLHGSTLTSVAKQPGDRVITFHFEHADIHALFFSGTAGNILVEGGLGIVETLHNKKNLVGTTMAVQPRALLLGEMLEHAGSNPDKIVQDYRASRQYYVLEKNAHVAFSAVPVPEWNVVAIYDDVFTALKHVVSKRRQLEKTNTDVGGLEKEVRRKLDKVTRSLAALDTDALRAVTSDELRSQAHALLSTHQADKERIQQAQKLFQKARASDTAAEERVKRRLVLQAKKEELELNLVALSTGNVPANVKNMTTQQPAPTPYRQFNLEEGYVLYVGRNSANNDQLTMRFAKQNDLWLHVRGQSGSHCVLRAPTSANSKVPKRILEQAASIAAYYSSARNASWTPVVYTLKKHVRKPKGAAVGAVVLEREEVIMARPGLPSGLSESS